MGPYENSRDARDLPTSQALRHYLLSQEEPAGSDHVRSRAGPFAGRLNWLPPIMGWLRILCFSVGLLASFSLLAAPPVETNSAYSIHLELLRKRLPSEFTIVLQHPFAVIGDEDGATVRRRSTNTVKWAVSRLK